MKNRFFSNLIPVLLIIILCIPVVLPYFKQGFFPSHDGEWAVVRLADMFRTLRDLQFPARYSGALNFGYGYPLFNFAYPFPYYFGILFYFLTQSFIVSIKSMFVLSVFLSGIFMYMASVELWKSKISGIVSAILYIYLPYRMVDLYVRGSIGESISLALFPLILYFAMRLFNSPIGRVSVFFLSILIGVLITTHNIMSVLFMPLLIFFVMIRSFIEKRFEVLQYFFLSIFLGLGISAFFWFPALYEKGNILLSTVPIADRNLYFVNIYQLLVPSWAYGSPAGSNGFSYQLGIAQTLVIIISFMYLSFSLLKTKFIQTPAIKYAITLLFVWIACFLMLFSFSSSIWVALPLLKEINYPWTLLSLLGLISALLGGFLAMQGKIGKYSLIFLAILAIIFVYPYARPFEYNNFTDNYYMTNEATTTSSEEYTPLWVVDHPKSRYINKVEVTNGSAQISNLLYKSNKINFTYKTVDDSKISINTIYYPGWQIYLNGEKINENHSNNKGIMEINAPKPGGNVLLTFEETSERILSDLASIVSLVILGFILLRPILLFKTK